MKCDGRGDDHCCWIQGRVCEFLVYVGSQHRCSIWDEIGGPEWQAAPVGARFAAVNPGYTCRDWPQNIPEVMSAGVGLCCWKDN